MNDKNNSCPKKDWFTSAELANLKLKGIPTAKDKLIAKALREGWTRRPRAGKRGGGYEYSIHCNKFPVEARMDLLSRMGSNYSVETELLHAKKELQTVKKSNTKVNNQLEFSGFSKNLATSINNQLIESTKRSSKRLYGSTTNK